MMNSLDSFKNWLKTFPERLSQKSHLPLPPPLPLLPKNDDEITISPADIERAKKAFGCLEKISQIVGTCAVPMLVYFLTESSSNVQKVKELEFRRQEALKSFTSQITTVATDRENFWEDPYLQGILRANALNVLRDSNLDRVRKGRVVFFLSDLGLVNPQVIGLVNPQPGSTKKTEAAVKNFSLEGDPRDLLQSKKMCLYKGFWKHLDKNYLKSLDKNILENLKKALPSISLNDAILSHADLKNVCLYGARLINSNFKSSNIQEANFIGARLKNATFHYTNAKSVNFNLADFTDANISNTKFKDASFQGADLRGAELVNSDFHSVSFDGAIFSKGGDKEELFFRTKFYGSTFYSASFADAQNLAPENFEGAYLCKTTLPPDIKLDGNRDCGNINIADPEQDKSWFEPLVEGFLGTIGIKSEDRIYKEEQNSNSNS